MIEFLKALFSGSQLASFGRVGSFIWLVFCLIWDTLYLFWHHEPMAGSQLMEQAAVIASLYAITKGGEVLKTNGAKP